MGQRESKLIRPPSSRQDLQRRLLQSLQRRSATAQLSGDELTQVAALICQAAHCGDVQLLKAILASGLPLNLAAVQWDDRPPLARAATGSRGNLNKRAAVRVLFEAGAPLTPECLLCAIDCLDAEGVAALLACGTPPLDMSSPSATAFGTTGWACPIHRALHALAIARCFSQATRFEAPALRILDSLRAAGFRPTTWQNALPPAFVHSGGAAAGVAAELDPFNCDRQYCHLKARDLFVARGGANEWTTATHHLWPARFKAAVRLLLLESHSSGRRPPPRKGGKLASLFSSCASGGPAPEPPGIGALPDELLQRIIRLAAPPMSVWL